MHKFSLNFLALVALLLTSLCAPATTANSTTDGAVTEKHLTSMLEYTSIIFALTSFSNETVVGPTCHAQLQQLRQATLQHELWALKVIDASGRPTAGFMYGDNFWLGSHEGCEAAENVITLNINKYRKRRMNPALLTATAPFDVDYRLLYLTHNSPWQVDAKLGQRIPRLHVGLCTPKACSLDALTQLMTHYLESDLYAQIDVFDLKPLVFHAKELKLSEDYFTQPIFLLVCAFVALTFIVTIAAFKASQRKGVAIGVPSQWQQFVNCFDVKANWHKLFVLPGRTTNTLSMLNGARFFSALMAIYFHVYILLPNLASNTMELFATADGVGCMDIAVDMFFSISGFLQAYNFLRDEQKLQEIRKNDIFANFKELLTNILHRIIRLGPLYLVVLAISDLWFKYRGEVGVFLIIAEQHAMCVNKGWYNVFFLQNFVEFSEGCQLWTWSLACDLQFFTLSAALLIIYARYPRVAQLLVAAVLIYCAVYTYHIGLTVNFQLTIESTLAFFKDMYVNPVVRVMPYLFGVITGWFYIEWNPKISAPKLVAAVTPYIMLGIFFFFLQSAPFGTGHSVRVDTLLLLLQRFCFSFSMCWCLVSLANGHVAWLIRIFNWEIFQKGFQLSFAMSVINEPLIFMLYSLPDRQMYIEKYTNTVMYIGLVAVLWIISGFFALFFEMPYRNWLSLLHKRQRAKAL